MLFIYMILEPSITEVSSDEKAQPGKCNQCHDLIVL